MSIDRRGFVGGSLATGLALGVTGCVPPDQSPAGRLVAALRIIEANAGGTLGAELFEVNSGRSIGLNRNRRFGHCSSFKTSLAAKVLQRHASGEDDADRVVTWEDSDVLSYAPFTKDRREASLRELAKAMQITSDNTAANVLLREIGGPAAVTAFWRSLGDDVSRLDRIEPQLNNVPVTEVRDTSTPAAMSRTVAKLIYGDALPETERAELKQWMVDTVTGPNRVRAGLPDNWLSGDKTGTSFAPGMGSLYVDIGFAEEPGSETGPVTFAAYFRARTQHERIEPAAELALAQVGRLLRRFAQGDRILGL